jgi:protein-tyrosine phosphatase
MPFKKIIKNLYLGDQFANKENILLNLKISPNFYDVFSQEKENILLRTKKYVLTKNVLALNLVDSYDPRDFDDTYFAAAVKFIKENLAKKEDLFVHCQMGLSRSPSTVFIYLVTEKIIDSQDFHEALNQYITNYYPYMKVNFGVYQYLKTHFPFENVKQLAEKK